MRVEHLEYAVVPDLHGRYQLLEAIAEKYDNLIIAGDFVDGGDTNKTIELISQLPSQTVVLSGNHDYVLHAAMYEANEESREVWGQIWRWPYHERVLSSYGLPNRPSADSAKILKETMPEHHRKVLESAALYCIGPTFFVVHAGITDASLAVQMHSLDTCQQKRTLGDFNGEVPLQLTGKDMTEGTRVLNPDDVNEAATALNVLDEANIDVMINGHWHREASDPAYKAGGRIVHLALNPDRDEIPVYEAWTGNITMVRPRRFFPLPPMP